MPLLLAVPLITGLAGLFFGSQVENKLNNPTTPPAGGIQDQSKMPWYITLALIIVGAIAVLWIVKKVLKSK